MDGKQTQRMSVPAAAVTNLVLPDPTSTALTINSISRLQGKFEGDQHWQVDAVAPRRIPARRARYRDQPQLSVSQPTTRKQCADTRDRDFFESLHVCHHALT